VGFYEEECLQVCVLLGLTMRAEERALPFQLLSSLRKDYFMQKDASFKKLVSIELYLRPIYLLWCQQSYCLLSQEEHIQVMFKHRGLSSPVYQLEFVSN
jgi:hypothetical protein